MGVVFHSIIFSLPVLAYGGYLSASFELAKESESNPLAILEILANSNFSKEVGVDIVFLSDLLQFLIYPSLLLTMLLFVVFRQIFEKKFYSTRVQYSDGTFVNISKGKSILEASHTQRIKSRWI